MTKLPSRLLRQLSFANVIACIALFVALGGVGYAAATINGNAIKQQTIGAGKLKKGTLTSVQVKQNALGGDAIDESTLSVVPAAQSAVTAQSATTAQSAVTATSATTATRAATAQTLDGLSPEDLRIACPVETSLFGGMCWDDDVRPIKLWIAATIECGEDGGRLPTLGELIAYVAQPGAQVAAHNWSADVVDVDGGTEEVATADEDSRATSAATPATFGYRCVFYRSN
jgi:hypothetical protein